MPSGQMLGQEYVKKFDSYLQEGRDLPLSGQDGTLNLAELSRITGIPKNSFYQNLPLKERLTAALEQRGVARRSETTSISEEPKSDDAEESAFQRGRRSFERRIHILEQQLAVVIGENTSLRSENKMLRLQLGREDMMIETGRRVLWGDSL
ncbi:hypothetical protein J2777_001264 [Paraburkholderia graminis]|uniref:hypothetical protein n=1 Tax=Paraburkholderia graminis TaxID=60548 RepID=UPI00285816A4|nr:hypothetical protein [Paraburkholderia graminis]MDR6467571.1 hypothetical protein [Paraburkholderia graminis]